MQVNELVPFKKDPVFKKAKKTFPAIGTKKALKKQDDKGKALDTFNKFLKEKGFKQLGTGSFGTVFESPNYPWVFKLFYNDPAYFKFFEFARANQKNPYLPKIKGKYIKLGEGIYVIRLEKLDKLGWSVSRFPGVDYLLNMYNKSDIKPTLAKIKKVNPTLAKTVAQIYKLIGPEFDFDLHGGNMMVRNGNQIVITDPIYSPELNKF